MYILYPTTEMLKYGCLCLTVKASISAVYAGDLWGYEKLTVFLTSMSQNGASILSRLLISLRCLISCILHFTFCGYVKA